jgi:hypothetical protein
MWQNIVQLWLIEELIHIRRLGNEGWDKNNMKKKN